MQVGTETSERRAAAYLPFKTWQTVLAQLGEAMPPQIDRSVFRNHSGATQNEIMAALRFFALVNGSGVPTPELEKLAAADETQRKQLTRKLLERAYGDLIALDMARATYKMFDDALEERYGVSGTTKRKAARFFISASQYAGMTLSKWITDRKPTAASGLRRGRKPTTVSMPDERIPIPPSRPERTAAGTALKTIALDSGGSLTISGDFNVFELSDRDRDFVNRLIVEVQTYHSAATDGEAEAG